MTPRGHEPILPGDENDEADDMPDRRTGHDRRVEDLSARVITLEQLLSQMRITVAVTETAVAGLKSTIDSRFVAFDRGIDLILKNQKTSDDNILACTRQIAEINNLRKQGEGVIWFARLLGIGTIIGLFIWLAKVMKG